MVWKPVTCLLLALASAAACAGPPSAPAGKGTEPDERFTWGRFGEIAVYKPADRPIRSVAILLTGDGGWSPGATAMADHLRKDGALVAGIDLPHYLKQLGSGGDCAYPSGEFEDFAHHFEQRYGLWETLNSMRSVDRECQITVTGAGK